MPGQLRNNVSIDITAKKGKGPKTCQTHYLQRDKWPKYLMWLPERGLEDLSGSALLGVVIVPVEKVSEHSLVCRDVSYLNTVYSLSAGLRQRQARPPVWTALVVLDAPKVTGVESLITLFRVFFCLFFLTVVEVCFHASLSFISPVVFNKIFQDWSYFYCACMFVFDPVISFSGKARWECERR